MRTQEYPFSEGDTYYTIEYGLIVESVWDYISEMIYDENPNQKYYESREEAEEDYLAPID